MSSPASVAMQLSGREGSQASTGSTSAPFLQFVECEQAGYHSFCSVSLLLLKPTLVFGQKTQLGVYIEERVRLEHLQMMNFLSYSSVDFKFHMENALKGF